MENAVAEFLEYLSGVKNYSPHTTTAYETDIRDFLNFYAQYNGGAPFPSDLSRADTTCFRAFLANRQKRGLASKSTARALSSLRSFYKFLAKNYAVKNDAISLISSPKVPRNLSKSIDPIDIENMHGAIRATQTHEPWIAARDWAL
ncbi:MAG: site-specific integrase, partial [Alphaproteobacteria bacterium]|nr:site-specific integrase [Alphaproteobacteria bacterium]